jgi:hypothetical protein
MPRQNACNASPPAATWAACHYRVEEAGLIARPVNQRYGGGYHLDDEVGRIYRARCSACSVFCRVTSNMLQLFVRGFGISKAPLQARAAHRDQRADHLDHRTGVNRSAFVAEREEIEHRF